VTSWILKEHPFCIAEIGGNHQGNFQTALELTDLALSTRVDAVKFQTYFADSLIARSVAPDRWTHFKSFELTLDQHVQIAEKIVGAGKTYMSSIWDRAAFEALKPYLRIIKIGSGDLTSLEFLELAADSGLPIILSTGLSFYSEVEHAVGILRSRNSVYKEDGMLILLQCTSMYPIKNEDANLAVMGQLRNLVSRVGYSDHTVGNECLKAAYMMGAEYLEFHFSNDKTNESFRDHLVSLEVDDVNDLYAHFDFVQTVYGNEEKKPLEIEIANSHVETFRRGFYARETIKKGESIDRNMIMELRPNPKKTLLADILGKVAKFDIQAGQSIDNDNIIQD